MLLKLTQLVSISYLSLRSLKTSILSIFSKELFSSEIFSREEILRIKNKKMRIANTGNKVIIEKLLNIKRQHASKIDTACFNFLPTVKIA